VSHRPVSNTIRRATFGRRWDSTSRTAASAALPTYHAMPERFTPHDQSVFRSGDLAQSLPHRPATRTSEAGEIAVPMASSPAGSAVQWVATGVRCENGARCLTARWRLSKKSPASSNRNDGVWDRIAIESLDVLSTAFQPGALIDVTFIGELIAVH
jgi:hypothetical protein